jgi:hypothetical protein
VDQRLGEDRLFRLCGGCLNGFGFDRRDGKILLRGSAHQATTEKKGGPAKREHEGISGSAHNTQLLRTNDDTLEGYIVAAGKSNSIKTTLT